MSSSSQFDSFCLFLGVDAIEARQGRITKLSGERVAPLMLMLHRLRGTPAYDAALGAIRGLLQSVAGSQTAD